MSALQTNDEIRSEVNGMKVVELRKMLKLRGLDSHGDKEQLRAKCFDLLEDDVAALLRKVLEGRHLATGGTKLELEARLRAAEAEEAAKIEQMMAEFANEKRGVFERQNAAWMEAMLARIAADEARIAGSFGGDGGEGEGIGDGDGDGGGDGVLGAGEGEGEGEGGGGGGGRAGLATSPLLELDAQDAHTGDPEVAQLVEALASLADAGEAGGAEEGSSTATQLRSLRLPNNNVPPYEGIELLTHLGAAAIARTLLDGDRLHCLAELCLAANAIGDGGAVAIAQVLGMRNSALRMLDVTDNGISPRGCAALLTALDNNAWEERDPALLRARKRAGEVFAPHGNTTLQELSLGSNLVRDAGAAALCAVLQRNATLTSVDVRWGEVSERGGVALARALARNHTLRELYLQFNGIGEAGAIALARTLRDPSCATLETLYLDGNGIGEAGAAALFEALEANRERSALYDSDILERSVNQSRADAKDAIAADLKKARGAVEEAKIMQLSSCDRQKEKDAVNERAADKMRVLRKEELQREAEEVPAAVRRSVVPGTLRTWQDMLAHGDESDDDF